MFGMSGILSNAKTLLIVAALAGAGMWVWMTKAELAALKEIHERQIAEVAQLKAAVRERDARAARADAESARALQEQSRAHAADVRSRDRASGIMRDYVRSLAAGNARERRILLDSDSGDFNSLAAARPDLAEAAVQDAWNAIWECMAVVAARDSGAEERTACLDGSAPKMALSASIRAGIAAESLNTETEQGDRDGKQSE